MKKLMLVLGGVVGLTAAVGLPIAYAHNGADAIRHHRGCDGLPQRWHHMKAECHACVDRPAHHFHPGYPDGSRCVHNGHK